MSTALKTGIDTLLSNHRHWIDGRRIALVSHAAAVDAQGRQTAARLQAHVGTDLVALLGPEHGYFGQAAAGEPVRRRKHPLWGIPVHSLYGRHRRPTPAMLKDVDAIVVDLCDIGVRCYTYVATLRYVLEAAARQNRPVVIADRPVPFARCVDGPMRSPAAESFVSAIAAPMVYGMTPGETARWLKQTRRLDVDLKVAQLRHYTRDTRPAAGWPPWHAPSPALTGWHAALCYPATVWGEALPAVDVGRGTALPFQTVAAPGLDADALVAKLRSLAPAGARFHPHAYLAAAGPLAGRMVTGMRITVARPSAWRPLRTAAAILTVLQSLLGDRLWRARGTRPDFFDLLHGGAGFREALQAHQPPAELAHSWVRDSRAFQRTRKEALLYATTRRVSA